MTEVQREKERKADELRKRRTDAQIAEDCKRINPNGKKFCSGCEKTLLISSFNAARRRCDGLEGICRTCKSKIMKAQKKRNGDRIPSEIERDRKRLRPNGTKFCSGCGETQDLSKFPSQLGNSDGLRNLCKECHNENGRLDRLECNAMRDEKRSANCLRCGETNVRCIDLHHVDRSTKIRNSAGRTVAPSALNSKLVLQEELKLVVPLCANCHSDDTQSENDANHRRRVLAGEISNVIARRLRLIQESRDFVNLEKTRRGSCTDCKLPVGTRFHAFDFDHVRGEKIASVASMAIGYSTYTTKDIASEMDKCDLRCKNCHRLITYARLQTKPTGTHPIQPVK